MVHKNSIRKNLQDIALVTTTMLTVILKTIVRFLEVFLIFLIVISSYFQYDSSGDIEKALVNS